MTAAYSISDGENGGLASNYSLADEVLTASITKKDLTISGIEAEDKVYDGSTSVNLDSSGIKYEGKVSGDDLSLESLEGQFVDKNADQDKTVNLSEEYSGADKGNYNIIKQQTALAEIKRRELLLTGITAKDKAFDNTREAEIAAFGKLTGVVEGDVVSLDSSQAEALFEDEIAGENKKVYITDLKLVGQDKDNYFIEMQITNGEIESHSEEIMGAVVKDVEISNNHFKDIENDRLIDTDIINDQETQEIIDNTDELAQTEVINSLNVSSTPDDKGIKAEGTNEIYLSELITEAQKSSTNNNVRDDREIETQIIRVKIDRESLIELVNGGIFLPAGVDQVFYLTR